MRTRLHLIAVALAVIGLRPVAAHATPIMTWEFQGTVTRSSGEIATYLPAGTLVTFDLFGDPDEPPNAGYRCPPDSGSAYWPDVRGSFTAGGLAWTGGSYLERKDEMGYCGSVGAPLDFIGRGWRPTIPSAFYFSQFYASLKPYSLTPNTLGEQLDLVNYAYGQVGVGPVGEKGYFSFSAEATPVPEPTTWLLVGTGIIGVLRRARRRHT